MIAPEPLDHASQTRRFLEGLSHDGRLPDSVRQEARRLLREDTLESDTSSQGDPACRHS